MNLICSVSGIAIKPGSPIYFTNIQVVTLEKYNNYKITTLKTLPCRGTYDVRDNAEGAIIIIDNTSPFNQLLISNGLIDPNVEEYTLDKPTWIVDGSVFEYLCNNIIECYNVDNCGDEETAILLNSHRKEEIDKQLSLIEGTYDAIWEWGKSNQSSLYHTHKSHARWAQKKMGKNSELEDYCHPDQDALISMRMVLLCSILEPMACGNCISDLNLYQGDNIKEILKSWYRFCRNWQMVNDQNINEVKYSTTDNLPTLKILLNNLK